MEARLKHLGGSKKVEIVCLIKYLTYYELNNERSRVLLSPIKIDFSPDGV